MASRYIALALVAPLVALAVPRASHANDETDCAGTPPQAVMTLPKPLDKWGVIACTPFGHVLTSRKGWLWILPAMRRPIFLPSQMVDRLPLPLGNTSYFKAIEVRRVDGEEFAKAYHAFHDGMDPHETLPEGYRVELTSSSGKHTDLYFFDYDTYAWGIECLGTACSRQTRFMILDEEHMPPPPGSSI